MAIDAAAAGAEVIASEEPFETAAEHPSAADDTGDSQDKSAHEASESVPSVRKAVVSGLAMLVSITGIVGWLGYRDYQSHEVALQRAQFISVGRQEVLNLTTIDYQQAQADVRRILDSATGQFYNEFSAHAQPFIDVVTKAQSKSVGAITEAGLESQSGFEAQVVVAVRVNTTTAGVPDPKPRAWRMRVTVQRTAGGMKVSKVGFVP